MRQPARPDLWEARVGQPPGPTRQGRPGEEPRPSQVIPGVGQTHERDEMRRQGKRQTTVPVPRLTPPDKRASVGGLYSAKLLFEFWMLVDGRPGVRRICKERLILLEAASACLALKEAKRQARASQYRSRNSDKNPVHFRFVGVLDLLHLGIECQPNEVWYDIRDYVRPMERRKAILPLEASLNAIRNEKTSLAAKL